MRKDEFIEKITEIGKADDIASIREQLVALSTDVEKDYDERDKLSADNKTLIDSNEKLRSANMDLFVQVGASKLDDIDDKDQPDDKDDKQDEKLSFDDLFNEKGVLK